MRRLLAVLILLLVLTSPAYAGSPPTPTAQPDLQDPTSRGVRSPRVQTSNGILSEIRLDAAGQGEPDPGLEGAGSELAPDYNNEQWEMVLAVNQQRRAVGLAPLRLNPSMAAASQWLAQDMADRRYFDHTDSLHRSFDQRLVAFGYNPFSGLAENIAAGYSSVSDVMAAWMSSLGHRNNILNSGYREIGIGYVLVNGSPYGRYWVQDFGVRNSIYPVVINNEARSTGNRTVNVYIYGSGYASQMMVSTDPTFASASWQPYQSEVSWQLAPGNGSRTIYVKLRSASGQEQVNSDDIELTGQPQPTATPQPPTATPCAGQRFSDVGCSYWAYTYVQELAGSNILGGYSDGTFRPRNKVSRGELAKMIVGVGGWPLLNPPTATFSDVPTGFWAYRYIETAYAQGVIGGFGGGLFRPIDFVTRDQLAKIVVRARGYGELRPATARFSDVPTNYWAFGYVEQAVALGIISGYGDGSYQPTNQSQRDQLSKILYNAVRVQVVTPRAGAPEQESGTPTTTPTSLLTPSPASTLIALP